MKRGLIILVLSIITCHTFAQQQWVGVGAHGGGLLWLGETTYKSKVSPLGAVDVFYNISWSIKHSDTQIALHTGLTLGYNGYSKTAVYENQFNTTFTSTVYDRHGSHTQVLNAHYTTSGDILVDASALLVEIPIMGGVRWEGLVANIGFKAQLPVWLKTTQSLNNAQIAVDFPDQDVHVVNDLLLGKAEDQVMDFKSELSSFNLLAGLEIGYEWRHYLYTQNRRTSQKNAFGFLFFCDINLLSSAVRPSLPVIEVTPGTSAENPLATVKYNLLYEQGHTRNLVGGIKLYYAFELRDNPVYGRRGMHHYRRGR